MSEHTHNHSDEKIRSALKIALLPLIVILILEIIGGVLSNSLALLSDAVHVFMDIFAISLSLFALQLICKLPNNKLTYGYHRSDIHSLSAHILVNDCAVSETEKIKNRINELVKKFGITHTTLQFECECNLKECNVQHGGV